MGVVGLEWTEGGSTGEPTLLSVEISGLESWPSLRGFEISSIRPFPVLPPIVSAWARSLELVSTLKRDYGVVVASQELRWISSPLVPPRAADLAAWSGHLSSGGPERLRAVEWAIQESIRRTFSVSAPSHDEEILLAHLDLLSGILLAAGAVSGHLEMQEDCVGGRLRTEDGVDGRLVFLARAFVQSRGLSFGRTPEWCSSAPVPRVPFQDQDAPADWRFEPASLPRRERVRLEERAWSFLASREGAAFGSLLGVQAPAPAGSPRPFAAV